jgi:hypothetical protein
MLGWTAVTFRGKWAQEDIVVWPYAAILQYQFSDGSVSWKLEGTATVSSSSVFTDRFANNDLKFLSFPAHIPPPPNYSVAQQNSP